MTPTREARCIALWQQGLATVAIAQALGRPVGTVKSRAHTLAHWGTIRARPRGGACPRQKAQPALVAGVLARTPLPADRGRSIRWNLHLSEGLRAQVKARAEARGLQDRQMGEDWLWQARSLGDATPRPEG